MTNGARVIHATLVITPVRDVTRIRFIERGKDDEGAWLGIPDYAREQLAGKRQVWYAPWFPSRV